MHIDIPNVTESITASGSEIESVLQGAHMRSPVSYTHLTLPTNREV